jgi:predicted butyrate kinase (DUF1464 family)
MNDIERRRKLTGKFAEPQERKMDIFDKISEAMDDFGIGMERNPVKELSEKMEMAKKAARFINVISDPEERERAIVDALKQAYEEGLRTSK